MTGECLRCGQPGHWARECGAELPARPEDPRLRLPAYTQRVPLRKPPGEIADAAMWAEVIRTGMGWDKDSEELRLRRLAIEQVAEFRAASLFNRALCSVYGRLSVDNAKGPWPATSCALYLEHGNTPEDTMTDHRAIQAADDMFSAAFGWRPGGSEPAQPEDTMTEDSVYWAAVNKTHREWREHAATLTDNPIIPEAQDRAWREMVALGEELQGEDTMTTTSITWYAPLTRSEIDRLFSKISYAIIHEASRLAMFAAPDADLWRQAQAVTDELVEIQGDLFRGWKSAVNDAQVCEVRTGSAL